MEPPAPQTPPAAPGSAPAQPPPSGAAPPAAAPRPTPSCTAQPRPAERTASLGGLLLVLMIVCLALGMALSWALHERGQRRALAGRADILATRNGLIEARAGELRAFLALPQTRLVHLRGINAAAGQDVTIAWNPARREGYLLGKLPQDSAYILLAREEDTTMELATLDPQAGPAIAFTALAAPSPDARFELRPADTSTTHYVEMP